MRRRRRRETTRRRRGAVKLGVFSLLSTIVALMASLGVGYNILVRDVSCVVEVDPGATARVSALIRLGPSHAGSPSGKDSPLPQLALDKYYR